MPGTLQALGVLIVALLPGALYIWAFERQVGRWGIGLGDRALRFFGGSAMFHVAIAPLSYVLWTDQWEAVRSARPVSWWLWLVLVLYVALPWAAGTVVGSRPSTSVSGGLDRLRTAERALCCGSSRSKVAPARKALSGEEDSS